MLCSTTYGDVVVVVVFVVGRRGQVGEEQVQRVGGGMRGGQGDIVRNQRREQHKQRQHRLLNHAEHRTGKFMMVVFNNDFFIFAGWPPLLLVVSWTILQGWLS